MRVLKNTGYGRGFTAHEFQIRRLQVDILRCRFWPTSGVFRFHWWPKDMLL